MALRHPPAGFASILSLPLRRPYTGLHVETMCSLCENIYAAQRLSGLVSSYDVVRWITAPGEGITVGGATIAVQGGGIAVGRANITVQGIGITVGGANISPSMQRSIPVIMR